jgi:phosphate transport system permease protein
VNASAVLCWLLAFVCLYGLVTWRTDGALVAKDRLGSILVWAGGIVAFLPVVTVVGFVAAKGWPVVSARFPHFLTADMSRAGPLDSYTEAGMRHAIIGTLEQAGIARSVWANS